MKLLARREGRASNAFELVEEVESGLVRADWEVEACGLVVVVLRTCFDSAVPAQEQNELAVPGPAVQTAATVQAAQLALSTGALPAYPSVPPTE